MNPVLEAVFNSPAAMQILLFLENYNQGHASRIATTYDVSLTGIQRQLKRLEAEGVLTSTKHGNIRLYQFNDRSPTVKNLRRFLAEELELLPKQYRKDHYRQRQRPRRAGKPL